MRSIDEEIRRKKIKSVIIFVVGLAIGLSIMAAMGMFQPPQSEAFCMSDAAKRCKSAEDCAPAFDGCSYFGVSKDYEYACSNHRQSFDCGPMVNRGSPIACVENICRVGDEIPE
jgi:hypothetical protein